MSQQGYEWLFNSLRLGKGQTSIVAIFWIAIVSISLIWNWMEIKSTVITSAKKTATSSLQNVLSCLQWSSAYGGVYVPIRKEESHSSLMFQGTPGSVNAGSSAHLTWLDHISLVRRIFDHSMDKNGFRLHIVDIDHLQKDALADPWEKKAVSFFKSGSRKLSSIQDIGGVKYLRVAWPLFANEDCLKCHSVQGVHRGDILGEVSLAEPFKPYSMTLWRRRIQIAIAHLFLGLLGLLGLWISCKRMRRYTAALQEREERLRTLMNATPDIICFKDGEGRWLEANDADLKLFSIKDVDYIGKKDSELAQYTNPIYKKAFLTCEKTDEKTWQKADISRNEEIIPLPDGNKKVYDVIKVPLFNDDGTRKGLVVWGRDITERKQAERDLQMLMFAIEQAGDSIVITDTDGTIKYVNPAFERITGYSRKEAIGRNPRILKSGKQDRNFYKKLWDTISWGKIWHGRLVNKRKDGTFFVEDATISPVYDEKGNLFRYIAIKHDVTEHIRLFTEKEHLKEQLQQAQKLESIGRLAGGVAHDLNNMLTPIFGYAELILDTFDEKDSRKAALEQIISAANRARRIVRQLLTFSRRQTVMMEQVDLNKILSDLEKLLRRTLREDIEIKLLLDTSIPSIIADAGQIEQVVMNLAVNAQDAMPNGGVLIIETKVTKLDDTYASRHPDVKPGPYVLLSVSDTGCGMDAETCNKIFEPFFTTKDKDKGTGLGLSTVYGIVKKHNGHIRVYSCMGKGTTFKIFLPILCSSNIHAKPRINSSLNGLRKQGHETILLVEDDKYVRELVSTILKKYGYKLIEASDGEEAITLLNHYKKEIDLLLTDVIMPGMNGKELFETLSKEYKKLKVIYMSGYSEYIVAHHGILEKGIVFIQKPFTSAGLLTKIREVLDK